MLPITYWGNQEIPLTEILKLHGASKSHLVSPRFGHWLITPGPSCLTFQNHHPQRLQGGKCHSISKCLLRSMGCIDIKLWVEAYGFPRKKCQVFIKIYLCKIYKYIKLYMDIYIYTQIIWRCRNVIMCIYAFLMQAWCKYCKWAICDNGSPMISSMSSSFEVRCWGDTLPFKGIIPSYIYIYYIGRAVGDIG